MTSTPNAELLQLLAGLGRTVATAESLTGGLLCSDLVEVPGASRVVLGGVVSYATRIKVDVLGVPVDVVEQHGVVSSACAEAMARGVRRHLGADVGLSTTGVAGPELQDGQPVGTVFVGLSVGLGSGEWTTHTRLRLAGDRAAIRAAAVREALLFAHSELRHAHW